MVSTTEHANQAQGEIRATRDFYSGGVSPESELDALRNRINSCVSDIGKITDELREHADKVFGSRPMPESGQDECQTPEAKLDQLNSSLARLESYIADLRQEASRNCQLA